MNGKLKSSLFNIFFIVMGAIIILSGDSVIKSVRATKQFNESIRLSALATLFYKNQALGVGDSLSNASLEKFALGQSIQESILINRFSKLISK